MKTALPYLAASLGLCAGVAIVACGGDDGDVIVQYVNDGGSTVTLSDGAVVSASKILTSSKTVASDTTCPDGGVILSFGVDTNGNGILDPGEVTSTQEICTGVDAGAASVLTKVVTTGPDEKCAAGGTIFESGVDTNRDGILEDSEVTASTEICNGNNPNGVLTVTIALPLGDPNCPLGGTETETGVDNGDGDGGVAGDGILEPGEVTSTTYQCSNGQPDAGSGSLTPPPAVPNQPTYTFDTSGGAGSTNGGGGSGYVQIQTRSYYAAVGVGVFSTGVATAPTVAVPTPTPAYGTTAFDVTANTTVATHTQATQAAVGEYYVMNGNLYYAQDATNNQVAVTGLHVEPNITLTIANGTINQLANDVVIEGTVNAATGINAIGLSSARNLIVGANASFGSKGATVAGSNGTDGSNVSLSGSMLIEQAPIDTSGGSGDATHGAGNAGAIALSSSSSMYVTGALTANGGDGGTGTTSGNAINLNFTQTAYVTGAVTAKGGNGLANGISGSSGGDLYVNGNPQNVFETAVVTTGAIDVSGGNALATATGNANGGNGGTIRLSNAIGGWFNTGDLRGVGGTAAPTGTGTGGNGGQLNDSYEIEFANAYSGPSQISGNIAFSGGAGPTGGSGGSVYVYMYTYAYDAQSIHSSSFQLLGYPTIKMNGGDGVTGGANSNGLYIYGYSYLYNSAGTANAPVLVTSAINANGGKAITSGNGGSGGSIDIEADVGTNDGASASGSILSTAGTMSANGGDGVNGGNSGSFYSYSRVGTSNTGAISLVGGNGSAGSGGSANNEIQLYSYGLLYNTGALVGQGGNGAGTGGNGGSAASIELNGQGGFTNTAAITSTGGTSAAATGGNGANISVLGSPYSNTGSYASKGGTGTTAGTAGTVTINNAQQ